VGDALPLLAESLKRIESWELSGQQKRVLRAIVNFSFGWGAMAVTMRYAHLSFLSGIHVGDVGRIVDSLTAAGVLQVSGRQRGARRFIFLPNATLVTPPLTLDAGELERVTAEVRALNVGGVNCEPGSQQQRLIYTADESLSAEQAAASRALALENAAGEGDTAPAPAGLRGDDRRRDIERLLQARGMHPDDVPSTRNLPVEMLERMVHREELAQLGETPSYDANSVKHRERSTPQLGETPSCFMRAGVRAERSNAPPYHSAKAERSSARASACAGERERTAVSNPDDEHLLEQVFAWFDQGDAWDRQQRTEARFAVRWKRDVEADARAMRLALDFAKTRSSKEKPIKRRWAWLSNRYWREHEKLRGNETPETTQTAHA
jgi:hypothetical protein